MYGPPLLFSLYSYPPRAFIPALCKIMMDMSAPDNVLEVTARALTYYLDVSVDCTRRITSVDGALRAIVRRVESADLGSRSSKDVAEQCVKVRLENQTGVLIGILLMSHSDVVWFV